MKVLHNHIHQAGMISIDDSKLADIGDTNDSGFYHASCEGYDLVTYAPFPGNVKAAAQQAKHHGVGLITLVLMSNPEFEVMKNATIDGMKGFEYFAHQVKQAQAEGIVIGAPSSKNHTSEEIQRVYEILGDQLVLVPGIGAQGGSLEAIIKIFGERTITNVGRAIMYADDPRKESLKYRDMINSLRK